MPELRCDGTVHLPFPVWRLLVFAMLLMSGINEGSSVGYFNRADETYWEIGRALKNSRDNGRLQCSECRNLSRVAVIGLANKVSGVWVRKVCSECSERLRQIPAVLNATSIIPLKRRCEQCKCIASYSQGGGKLLRCRKHKLPSDVKVKSQTCLFEGCNIARLFGPPGGTAQFCSRHKKTGHVDLKNRRCQTGNCTRQPSFGLPSSGDMVSCAAHRAPDHVDLKNNAKRCRAIEGCPKIALFGFRSEGKAIYCRDHRRAGHVDVAHSHCQHPEGCLRQPSFGDPAEGLARFCCRHKRPHFVDVKSNMCMYIGADREGCGRRATFGLSWERVPSYCSLHKGPRMVDVVHRQATQSNAVCQVAAAIAGAGTGGAGAGTEAGGAEGATGTGGEAEAAAAQAAALVAAPLSPLALGAVPGAETHWRYSAEAASASAAALVHDSAGSVRSRSDRLPHHLHNLVGHGRNHHADSQHQLQHQNEGGEYPAVKAQHQPAQSPALESPSAAATTMRMTRSLRLSSRGHRLRAESPAGRAPT